jgi:hypothetical protein
VKSASCVYVIWCTRHSLGIGRRRGGVTYTCVCTLYVYVVRVRCTCTLYVYVVRVRCTCTLYVYVVRCTCTLYVVRVRCTLYVYVVRVRCTCTLYVYVVRVRCTLYVYVVRVRVLLRPPHPPYTRSRIRLYDYRQLTILTILTIDYQLSTISTMYRCMPSPHMYAYRNPRPLCMCVCVPLPYMPYAYMPTCLHAYTPT